MGKQLFNIIIMMIVLFLTITLRADWTTYRGDQARTGYYGGASALSVPIPYATVVISESGTDLSQPVKSGNLIYAGTSAGAVVKVDISNGASISGTYQTGGPIIATPLIYGGVLYFGSLDGQ